MPENHTLSWVERTESGLVVTRNIAYYGPDAHKRLYRFYLALLGQNEGILAINAPICIEMQLMSDVAAYLVQSGSFAPVIVVLDA